MTLKLSDSVTLVPYQESPYLRPRIVFEIDLETSENVYMTLESTSHVVVLVDSQKFINHMRTTESVHKELFAHGDKATWREDYKFDRATYGFSFGITNPVPLAYLGAFVQPVQKIDITYEKRFGIFSRLKEVPYAETNNRVGFVDGITRTMWLLAHGAKQFPISTSLDVSSLLHTWIGVEGTRPRYADELQPLADEPFKETDWFWMQNYKPVQSGATQ